METSQEVGYDRCLIQYIEGRLNNAALSRNAEVTGGRNQFALF